MSWPTAVAQGYQLRTLPGKQSGVDVHASAIKTDGFVCLYLKTLS